MKFIRNVRWEEVFTDWSERESEDPGWIACAESKGWSTWESWRMYTAGLLKLSERTWKLYQLTNPGVEIPDMLVGPFQGWQGRVARKNMMTFANFADDSQLREWMRSNDRIQGIIDGLPFSTQMIGLLREGTGELICIDGSHRAAAIALACDDQIDYSDVEMTIAIAVVPRSETFLLDYALQAGSDRPE